MYANLLDPILLFTDSYDSVIVALADDADDSPKEVLINTMFAYILP